MFRNRYVVRVQMMCSRAELKKKLLGSRRGNDLFFLFSRKNTQKPDDVFIQKFQRTFSDIIPSISQPDTSGRQEATELVDRTRYISPYPHRVNFSKSSPRKILTEVVWNRPNMDGSDMKPNEQFPQTNPGLRLSSPFVNPNSLSFLPFANQPNNFLIPNYGRFSGGLDSSRAGDLHTHPQWDWA